MAKKARNGAVGGGSASDGARVSGRPAHVSPPTATGGKAKGAKRPPEAVAAPVGPVANGGGGSCAKRRKVEEKARDGAAAAAQRGKGGMASGEGEARKQQKANKQRQQGDGGKAAAVVAASAAAEVIVKATKATKGEAKSVAVAAVAVAAAAVTDTRANAPVAAAAAAAADGADGAVAKPAGGGGARRAPNSNWEALKPVVAAAKRPPPPEHVVKRRAKAVAAVVAAVGEGGSAAAAAAVAAAGGRRPGLVGSETGLTKVLALDCEMVGVGPKGEESALARVSLVNASGAVLLDTFVQPKEKVTDYRTWVSGVRPSDLADGAPYDDVVQKVGDMVKGRILVGHAIGHDLRALRLEEHPRSLLRDTSKYPGLMKELPGGRKVSASLKDLAATHLGLAIQQGEHSPVDDARAALYLYQKHHREWEAAVKSGQLVPAVGGLGKKGRKAGGAGSGGGGKAAAGGRRRGFKGRGGAAKGRVKDRGAPPGVAAGGVRKNDGRGGKRDGKAGGRGRGGGKAGGKAPLWSLVSDPYTDL